MAHRPHHLKHWRRWASTVAQWVWVATREKDPYNECMAILSTTFGRVELSGKEADRFQRHMTEDKPNPAAKASLARGQAMLARIASIRQTKVNGKR